MSPAKPSRPAHSHADGGRPPGRVAAGRPEHPGRVRIRAPRTWALAAVLLLPACGRGCEDPQSPPPPAPPAPHEEAAGAGGTPAPDPPLSATEEPPPDAPDFLPAIEDPAAWRLLAAASTEHAVSRVEVVKLLLDRADDRLYFCQSHRWPIHYDFAVRFLQTPERPLGDRRAFNTRNYLRPDREMVMASLVHYLDPDLWTLELGPADTLSGQEVLALLTRVRQAVYFGGKLRYRPRSEVHRRHIAGMGDRLPLVESDEVWASVRYQPLTTGTAYGFLKIVRGEIDEAAVRPTDILVTAGVPDDMPLSAALVTSTLQTPLSHVAVLSQNRQTPNMALRGAVEDPRLTALSGQLVRLEVGLRDFAVRAATRDEADAAWASRRPAEPLAIVLDEDRTGIADVCDLRAEDTAAYGAKASQLGVVCTLGPPVETPGGVAVPVHHYLAHLQRHRIERGTEAMRARDGFERDRSVRMAATAARRTAIEDGDVDPELVSALAQRLARFRGRRLIFRSSTNAEDLPGFNGAGLYESVVVDADPGPAEIATALRQVWASVWTDRAFEEREWYRIDHARVAMAVLVQPFVDDVEATGVAITENPFSTLRSGSFVNLQAHGGSVTATTSDVPEQVLLYRHTQPEVLSRSSRTEGRPILRPEDMRTLRTLLDLLHERLVPTYGGDADAVDVELLLARHPRRFVIVQARPYSMHRESER